MQFRDTQENLCLPSEKKSKPNIENLTFGGIFTDHMLEIPWDTEKGWAKPIISPVHDLKLHPAAKVFHYAIEVMTIPMHSSNYILDIMISNNVLHYSV